MNWNWLLISEVIYVLLLILVCLRVVYDTRSTTKTIAYLLLIVFLPVIGIFIYFSFGINYRRRKMYSKKLLQNKELTDRLNESILRYSREIYTRENKAISGNDHLYHYLLNEGRSSLTGNNNVQLLLNGENKFSLVLEKLRQAQKHIHIEYYIYENDTIGNEIADILIEKAREGVDIRFIYDDFGSHSIRKKLISCLKNAGVKAFPFYKIKFIALANRLNYRNHRKIIIVDGVCGFVGGINVSDKYINKPELHNKLYWRDTHLFIEGPGVYYLQYTFLTDWNFCAGDHLEPNEQFFPFRAPEQAKGDKVVQFAASGPDSDNPTIQHSILLAIGHAKKELLITTPYFIPSESILEALIVAAYGGVKIKLLVPGISDSLLVNTAANSYYGDLLKAGVEIYRYKKGFVHAKTLVSDRNLAIVGTANMDHRSFELNFEVNALVYNKETAAELAYAFEDDLQDAEKINAEKWLNRPVYTQLFEKTCRLLSPLL
ncbi:cardiolipin synthase [Sinomicrobium weinanense]|uniref:Cardiolipin synthase n=1 Tax=Sinomicrobium weinanense TaxID=2842200 RepID=A0A926Q2L2_9FLAO|nr:cardiolipin synthase [Sinomicrobium weinanense]MBC9794785.1 cardiolipin synthase [Sinomicrobium weinanense]MBU3125044.1 cardiolipin synthase [Sinomicrobium weinanense]